jgi:hypothetical protein
MNIPIAVFAFLMLAGHGRRIDWKEKIENLKGVVLLKLGTAKKEAAKLNKNQEKAVAKSVNDEVVSDIRENDNQITHDEIRREFELPEDEEIVSLDLEQMLDRESK